jgi:putative transposase
MTMTHGSNDTQSDQLGQADFQALLREKMRQAVRLTLITILEEEVESFVGAGRYERTSRRRDQRNGSYSRDLVTGVGRIANLRVPRTRKGFQTQVFQSYKRRQAELDEAICDMFVQGMSMERVGEVFEDLTGSTASPSTISRVFHTLEGEFAAWRTRPLAEHYVYAFADGTYFSVIYDGEGHKMPILAVIGINRAGKREMLGFTVGERENQGAWEDLCDDLKRRGVKKVDLWITDGNQATINALELKFSDSQRQRCVQHKMKNVLDYVPNSQQKALRLELRAIFYQESREKADQEVVAFCEKYVPIYPSAVACLKRDLEACLTFYAFPKTHWKTIRTTNVLERTFGEVKKRSHKMAAAFRNENSCLLMFYAVIRSLRFQNLRMPTREPESAVLHKT